MRCLILLHSTTGNTRLVSRYARRFLQQRGVQCDLHVVGKGREAPSLEGVDLLGIAFPVMYFQPTLAMTAAVEALAPSQTGLPAFVLATAAGDPGAALHQMVEQLEGKGCLPLEAHWVICPSNWPLHLMPIEALERGPVVGRLHGLSERLLQPVWRRWPQLRPIFGLGYKQAMVPEERDRRWLDQFLDLVLDRQREAGAGRPVPRPDLERHTHSVFIRAGEATPVAKAASLIGLSCDPALCTACGLCSSVCPAGCVTPGPEGVPTFGPGCTGCYACYNACDQGALSAISTPHGAGRYPGPPRQMRQLFGERGV